MSASDLRPGLALNAGPRACSSWDHRWHPHAPARRRLWRGRVRHDGLAAHFGGPLQGLTLYSTRFQRLISSSKDKTEAVVSLTILDLALTSKYYILRTIMYLYFLKIHRQFLTAISARLHINIARYAFTVIDFLWSGKIIFTLRNCLCLQLCVQWIWHRVTLSTTSSKSHRLLLDLGPCKIFM